MHGSSPIRRDSGRLAIGDAGLSALIERSIRGNYEGIAIVDGKRECTFGAIEARGFQIARRLIELGVRTEDRVVLLLPRSVELVASFLGVLAAGAAFVPIDVSHSWEWIVSVLRDSGARYVLTAGARLEQLPDGVQRLLLDELPPPDDQDSVFLRQEAQRPDSLAYVIHTSDSTGTPRAVCGTHGAALGRIRWMLEAEPPQEADVFLQTASPSVVDCIWEILGPLAAGRQNVLLGDRDHDSVEAILVQMEAHGVTRVALKPSQLSALLDEAPDLGGRISALRHVTTCGEPLSPRLAERLRRAAPAVRHIHLFGATETAGDAIRCVVGPRAADVRVGTPLANTEVYVLDESLRPVPDGELGALYAADAGCARGYFARPALTAERFLPDPFARRGGRMYRIGDRGRRRADGHIELVVGSEAARTPPAAAVTLSTHATAAGPGDALDREAPALEAVEDDAPVPLSREQELSWLFEQGDASRRLRNVAAAIRLEGPIRVDLLRRAIDRLTQRHPLLRASLPIVAGAPALLIHANLALPLTVIDCSAGADAERRALNSSLAARQDPFNAMTPPLVRWELARIGPEDGILTLAMHHLIADRWSSHVLLRDLAAFYEASATGASPALPEIPLQFRDFTRWLRAQADSAFWKRVFEDRPAPLQLPTDRPRAARATLAAGQLTFEIADPLRMEIEELARARSTTTFTVVAAAFKTLLYRYTAQADIVIASIVRDRRPELENLIGHVSSTVAYRSRIRDAESFEALVDELGGTMLAAHAHPNVPYDEIGDGSQDDSVAGLSPVLISFVGRAAATDFHLAGTTATMLPELPRELSRFELELNVEATGDGLSGLLVFNRALFERRAVARMRDHLVALLRNLVDAPGSALGRVPILDEGERARLVQEWNGTAVDDATLAEGVIPSVSPFVPELVEQQALRTPDAVAVISGDEKLTYRELVSRMRILARRLRAMGALPDTPIGISVNRSLEMIVGVLGILKAGAPYVPLDPAYPADRLAYMFETSGARILCATEAPTFPVSAATTVVMLDVATLEDGPSSGDDASSLAIHPEQLAYVIFTSGSTGKPKGVQIPHRALANLLRALAHRLQPSSGDVLAAVTSLSFDIAGLELYLPLVTGATLVIVRRDEAMDGAQLAARLERASATIVQATPTTWRLLLDAGWSNPTTTALVGGEPVPGALAGSLARRARAVWNVYGPTETTIWSATARLVSSDVTIGGPLANSTLYVLDRHMEPCPIGVPGELYIGGAGLARGYRGRPDLTADRFVPSPFGKGGERLYRTGDLTKRRADGSIEFLGRIDQQIKIRGFRVELGEIEAVLASAAGVKDVAVVVREDTPENPRIVAYLVADEKTAPPVSELRALASSKLPDYMVPSRFVYLDAFPLTPNGKVDRKALPKPALPSAAPRARSSQPSDVAMIVRTSWIEALSLEATPSFSSSFDELGGQSIALAKVVADLRRSGVEIPFGKLHGGMTLEAMALAIEEHARGDDAAARVELADAPASSQGGTALRALGVLLLEVFAFCVLASLLLRLTLAALGPSARRIAEGPSKRTVRLVEELPRVAKTERPALVFGSSTVGYALVPDQVDAAFAARGERVTTFNMGIVRATAGTLHALATMTRDSFRREGNRAAVTVVELTPSLVVSDEIAGEDLVLAEAPLDSVKPMIPLERMPGVAYERFVLGLPPDAFRELAQWAVLYPYPYWPFGNGGAPLPTPQESLNTTVREMSDLLGYRMNSEWRYDLRGAAPRDDGAPGWEALRASEAARIARGEHDSAERRAHEVLSSFIQSIEVPDDAFERGAVRAVLSTLDALREVSDHLFVFTKPLAPYASVSEEARRRMEAVYRDIAKTGSVPIIELEDEIFDADDFVDVEHLSLKGGPKMSRALGERLADRVSHCSGGGAADPRDE